jgi:phosphoribosylanthranilate isomerase
MKLKVCGMKYPDNLLEVAALKPNYLGFIFYPASKRYMVDTLSPEAVAAIDPEIKTVAVFVNETEDKIESIANAYGIKILQLHGEESPELCLRLRKKGFKIIKVFSIGTSFDFRTVVPYKHCSDYFLFDTKSEQYGGTGTSFNWEILREYDNEIPFFLSGGVGLENIEEVMKLKGLNLFALDVNSKVEVEPGRKDIEKLKKLAQSLKLKA